MSPAAYATVDPGPVGVDPLDADRVLGATGLLGAFNRAGVIGAADVHVGLRLARLGGDDDEGVALAAALAVRGPRFGHVCLDLAKVRDSVADVDEDIDINDLPWPDPDEWLRHLAASDLVSLGDGGPADRPLRLVGTSLYLDRYWRDERAVAADLIARANGDSPTIDEGVLSDGLARLFPDDRTGEQRWAAAAAVLGRFTVIAGGPGTGKTTTLARLMALLYEQADAIGARVPLVGLAAPTGKAAARMEEAVHAEATRLAASSAVRERLLAADASTIHRLLGKRPDSSSRFRHHRHNRLPHDVLIVDETSMVPLSLMARLTEAVRADARLILVGDPEQLASVEAGAVLGDIVGPALETMRVTDGAAGRLQRVAGVAPPGTITPARDRTGDGIVVLRSNHRFRGALAELAAAIRTGDGDRAVGVLESGDDAVQWLAADPADPLPALRDAVVAAGGALVKAAVAGDGAAALDALGRFRVLCAHRRGPAGVAAWTELIEDWMTTSIEGFVAGAPWYVGRPIIVTANDYSLRLFNGDTGAVVARREGGVTAVFRRGGSLVRISPARLSSVDTVFAMTVHKAQGSEFTQLAVVLPPWTSPILSRELLYTAVTRARESVILAGSEESVRAAVDRPIARASGLADRLWSGAR